MVMDTRRSSKGQAQATRIRLGMQAPELVRAVALQEGVLAVEIRTYVPVHHARERIAAGTAPLVALSQHDADPVPPARLGRQRVLEGGLERLQDHFIPDGHVLALSSRVETLSGPQHLLVLDFACPPTAEGMHQVVAAVEHHGWRGVVLLTGSSFHFVGTEPLDAEAWRVAMGRALLLTDLIDVRYVGHTLVRGAGAARITACEAKPMVPRVVAVVGSER